MNNNYAKIIKIHGVKAHILTIVCCLLVALSSVSLASSFEKDIDSIREKLARKIVAEQVKNVAVIDFTDVHSNVTELGRFMAEELSTSLVLSKNDFSVIDRSHLKYILNEQKLSVSGLLNPKNTIKIGKLAGVDALILGTITPFGDNVRVTVKVLDTKTAHLITGERATIAKTKAIEELLNREVVVDYPVAGPDATHAGSAPRSYRKEKPATFTSNGLEFTAVKILPGKERVTAIVRIRNHTKKDVYLSLLQSDSDSLDRCYSKYIGTRLFSDNGRQGDLVEYPSIGVVSYNSSRCNTDAAFLEKNGYITVTLVFGMKGADQAKTFDLSSIVYFSTDPAKRGKRLSVTLTDIKPVGKQPGTQG